MTEISQPDVSGIRNVAVAVTDQDRAKAFYVEVLGLECLMDAPIEQLGGRWIEVAPPGGGTSIALAPAGTEAPAGRDTGIRLGTTDAAGLHSALADRGVAVQQLLNWPGVPPMFTFSDPDGNTLYVVE